MADATNSPAGNAPLFPVVGQAAPAAAAAATGATTTSGTAVANDAVQALDNTVTMGPLWYNVGIFGQIGYAIANPGNNIGSLNPQIIDITNLIGRSLLLIMHHEDADMSVPPSINTLVRIHQLVLRSAQIIGGRSVPAGVPNMETPHSSPAGEIFRVYPIPYFKVRNTFLKRWAYWGMTCLTDCFKHTENRKTVEISADFGAMIGRYMLRIYNNMAIELFKKDPATVLAQQTALAQGITGTALPPAFTLTQADFAAYSPGSWFTPQEMIDTVPSFDNVLTEERLSFLTEGIPLTDLPKLQPYPDNLMAIMNRIRAQKTAEINPDTGAQQTSQDRVTPAPLFPSGSSFV